MFTLDDIVRIIGSEEFDADTLDRANCQKQGELGHAQCGFCTEHDTLRVKCGCFYRRVVMEDKLTFQSIAQDVANLVAEKNEAYGSSFEVAGEFLKLLWPNGVPVESYSDMLSFVRTFDKMKRISTNPEYNGEDPHADMLGYALLNLKRKRTK